MCIRDSYRNYKSMRALEEGEVLLWDCLLYTSGGVVSVVHGDRPAVGPLENTLVLQLFQILPHRHQRYPEPLGELTDADLVLRLQQIDRCV